MAPDTADAFERAVNAGAGGMLALATTDGRYRLRAASVYLKRYTKGAQPGFLTAEHGPRGAARPDGGRRPRPEGPAGPCSTPRRRGWRDRARPGGRALSRAVPEFPQTAVVHYLPCPVGDRHDHWEVDQETSSSSRTGVLLIDGSSARSRHGSPVTARLASRT